jgi:hypothetical protein
MDIKPQVMTFGKCKHPVCIDCIFKTLSGDLLQHSPHRVRLALSLFEMIFLMWRFVVAVCCGGLLWRFVMAVCYGGLL